MKKIMIFAAFAAALSLASCQKEGLNEVVKNDPSAVSESPVFTGTINAGTKTTVDATEGKVSWETTDEITVTDKDQKTAVYSIESIDGTTGRATFVYKSDDTLGEGPYTATYGTEPAKVQTYSKTPGKIYMTAPETSTNSFNFTVQCALMEINLTKSGESVSSVAVTGTPTDGTKTTYILACIPALWIKYKTSFYIAVPAGVYNKIVITDDEGNVCTLTAASGITVANNHIMPLTFADTELDFAPSGVKTAAIKELEDKQFDVNIRIATKTIGFNSAEEVKQVIEPGREKIVSAKVIAINNINEATDESTIQNEKDNGLKVMEEEAQKTLAGIPNAIASYRARMKNDINDFATDANNKIDALVAPDKNQAKIKIYNAVAEAKTNIDNATDESNVEKVIKTAKININQQLANVAISGVEQAAATAKEEIDGLDVDESDKSAAKTKIDNIVSTATATINDATNKTWMSWTSEIHEAKDKIYEAYTQAITDIHNVVKDMWITVRENMTVGNYGTLCWKYDLTAIDGAELYTIAGIENGRIILEEVKVEETEAGAAYVIRATENTIRVKNGDQYTDTPLAADECNGLHGTFEEIKDGAAGADGNILEGNYIIYQNEWCKCGAYTGLRANSAYLIMDYVPNSTVTQAPNRKYISMPLPKETPTELESVDGSQRTIRNGKFLRNGQLIIVRDNKMYNAQGMKL